MEITAKDIAAILVDAAISEEKAEAFQSCCNERFGAGVTLNPLNLIDSGRFEVKTANATIFVAPEQSYLLETRVIDGRKYYSAYTHIIQGVIRTINRPSRRLSLL